MQNSDYIGPFTTDSRKVCNIMRNIGGFIHSKYKFKWPISKNLDKHLDLQEH